jgi:hypothetical protein
MPLREVNHEYALNLAKHRACVMVVPVLGVGSVVLQRCLITD